jgi:hypothetical protein
VVYVKFLVDGVSTTGSEYINANICGHVPFALEYPLNIDGTSHTTLTIQAQRKAGSATDAVRIYISGILYTEID